MMVRTLWICSLTLVLTACGGDGGGAGEPSAKEAPAQPPADLGPGPYDPESFRGKFAEAALPLFVSSESWKVDLPAEHVAAFSGSESESGAKFGAVARASIGEITVFVLREEGSSGSLDVDFAVGADGSVLSRTEAQFGQKSWLEENGAIRIEIVSYPEGSQVAEIRTLIYELDPRNGHVLREE